MVGVVEDRVPPTVGRMAKFQPPVWLGVVDQATSPADHELPPALA